jgi:hypothetical protein
MTTLPQVLSDHLPDYAPGRISWMSPEVWPLRDPDSGVGITTSIPRYALDVVTARTRVDPDRVRWLAERSATRPLETRHVHVVHQRGVLYVVDGHHALAAHLAAGSERIPVRLLRAA